MIEGCRQPNVVGEGVMSHGSINWTPVIDLVYIVVWKDEIGSLWPDKISWWLLESIKLGFACIYHSQNQSKKDDAWLCQNVIIISWYLYSYLRQVDVIDDGSNLYRLERTQAIFTWDGDKSLPYLFPLWFQLLYQQECFVLYFK